MEGQPAPEPREGAVGMAPEREAELLAAWKSRS